LPDCVRLPAISSTNPEVTVDVAVSDQLPLAMLLYGTLAVLEPPPQPMHSRQLMNSTAITSLVFTSFSIGNLIGATATKFRRH
jgi:hypothetical protein